MKYNHWVSSLSGQRVSATQTEVGKMRKESRDGRQRPLFLEKERDMVITGKGSLALSVLFFKRREIQTCACAKKKSTGRGCLKVQKRKG